jgi:ArsR family transcriptional regulator
MSNVKEYGCDCGIIHYDKIDKLRESMPADEEFLRLSDFFKVFGDYTRTKIVWALCGSEMCVCDIAEAVGITKSAISHQLRFLREANLVRSRREGKNIFYSLSDDHIKTIFDIGREHISEEENN